MDDIACNRKDKRDVMRCEDDGPTLDKVGAEAFVDDPLGGLRVKRRENIVQ